LHKAEKDYTKLNARLVGSVGRKSVLDINSLFSFEGQLCTFL